MYVALRVDELGKARHFSFATATPLREFSFVMHDTLARQMAKRDKRDEIFLKKLTTESVLICILLRTSIKRDMNCMPMLI